MTVNTDQIVELRDKDNRYSRLGFHWVLDDNDIQAIEKHCQNNGETVPVWLSIIKRLPRLHNVHGWWKPGVFQAKHCMAKLPSHIAPTANGMGWNAMLELREHINQATQWLRQSGVSTRWDYTEENASPTSAHTMFFGSAVLAKIQQRGIRVVVPSAESCLKSEGYVIYLAGHDAYLNPQHLAKGLNEALMFPSFDAADEIIIKKRLKTSGAQVLPIRMEVGIVPEPNSVGPRMREALAQRQADELSAGVPEVSDDHTRSAKPGPRL